METAHHGQQASCHTNGKIIHNAPTKVAVRQFFWAKSTKQYLKSSLSNSYCWDLNKVTMAGEGSYSLLVDGLTWEMIVSFYDGWSFVNILTAFWSRSRGWSLVDILMLKLGQYFEVEGFGQDYEADFWSRFWGWSLVEILKLNFDEFVLWYKCSYFVESTQPLGGMCFWQIFFELLCRISLQVVLQPHVVISGQAPDQWRGSRVSPQHKFPRRYLWHTPGNQLLCHCELEIMMYVNSCDDHITAAVCPRSAPVTTATLLPTALASPQ